MSRKIVSESQLLDLLNQEIKKTPEVEKCRISGIYKLKKQTEGACNWAVVYFSSPYVPLSVSEPEVRRIVEKIQPLYNLQ